MRAAAFRLLLAARSRGAHVSAAAVVASRRLALAVFVVVLAPAEASGVFADRAGLKAAVDDLATAEATHGPIAGWDVSRVDDLSGLFQTKGRCNSDVSKWDTSKVTSMQRTFESAASFNQRLDWDTSKVVSTDDFAYMVTARASRLPAARTHPCTSASAHRRARPASSRATSPL